MPLPLLALAAPLIGAAASIGGAAITNKANAREAQKNRDWQERMSNTAMTRQRADMMNAGINPAQLANAGGASTPGGAVAQVANPLEGGVANARDTYRTMQEVRNMKETNDLIRAQKEKTKIEGATAEAQGTVATETARKIAQDRAFELSLQPLIQQQMRVGNIMNQLMLPGLKNEARLQEKLGVTGAAVPWILNSAAGAKRLLK